MCSLWGAALPLHGNTLYESRCELKKKMLLLSLLLAMTFLIYPVNVYAAPRETDAAASLSNGVKNDLKNYINSYDRSKCVIKSCQRGRPNIAHYIVYFDRGDKSKIVVLFYPQVDYVYKTTNLHFVFSKTANDALCGHWQSVVYHVGRERPFDAMTADGLSSGYSEPYDWDNYSLLSEHDIIYSSAALYGKDNTSFFPAAPFKMYLDGAKIQGGAMRAQRQVLQTGKAIVIVVILVVSYLIFPIFWKKCLESLLPS